MDDYINLILENQTNKIQKINSASEYSNNYTIQNKGEDVVCARGTQKDNFSLKLLKDLSDWILKIIKNKIPNTSKLKLYRPNYKIFTHDTNLVDIYFFLDIRYKNILCMTPEIKDALNQLLIELGIKKKYKKKEVELNKNTKIYNDAIKLLLIYKYIDDKNKENIIDVSTLIIKLLINEGLKDPNEEKLYKTDKENIIQLLIKKGEKKSYNLQDKNKKNIPKLTKLEDINELNMTLRQLILLFYNTVNEFLKFSKKVDKINNYFKFQKNKEYSLLDNYNNNNGFIKMIEEDCNLTKEQKEKIKDLTKYFDSRELNVEEIQKYRQKITSSKKD